MAMNRVDQTLKALAGAPKTIGDLMGLLECSEAQARAAVANLRNRLMCAPVEHTAPLKYRLTETGREYLRTGQFRHPWKRGYKNLTSCHI